MTLWALSIVLVLVLACGEGAAPGTAAPTEAAPNTPVPAVDMEASPVSTPTPVVGPATPTPAREPPGKTRLADKAMKPTPTTPTPTTPPTATTPAAAETPGPVPAVTIGETSEGTSGGTSFLVEVADTAEARYRGLSGRESLAEGTGMLFVFQSEGVRTFWMKEMNFPLDMVWIDASCKVVDISRDVPPPMPGQTLGDLPTYGPATPAMYVLEVNAGVSGAAGVEPGDIVSFTGSLVGQYGC